MRSNLRSTSRVAGWLATMLAMIAPALAAPQPQPQNAPGKTPAPKIEQRPKAKKTPNFADLTRVSTSDAARDAAEDAAKKKQDQEEGSGAAKSDSVLELHSVSPGAAPEVVPLVIKGDNSNHILKKIHGEVYGAAGQGGKTAGGAAGMSAKDGKLNVYIETQHSTSNAPTPH
jgi:hypothetical protein